MEHTFYRRLLSAVCAIALAFTAVCPAVAAAPEDTTGTPQTLTVSEVQEMQQTDAAVTALEPLLKQLESSTDQLPYQLWPQMVGSPFAGARLLALL